MKQKAFGVSDSKPEKDSKNVGDEKNGTDINRERSKRLLLSDEHELCIVGIDWKKDNP